MDQEFVVEMVEIQISVKGIWDPEVPLCYSRTSGWGRHTAWAGNQQLKRAGLRLVSCVFTEVLYRRKEICASGCIRFNT